MALARNARRFTIGGRGPVVAVETSLAVDTCRLPGAVDTDAATVAVDVVDVE